MALIVCPECQKEVSDQADTCPNCGFPLSKSDAPTSPITNNDGAAVLVSPPSAKKKIVPIIVAIAVILVGAVCVFLFVNQSRAAKAREEYITNLNLAKTTMLQGGAEAENACNLIRSVWYNAIFKKSDSATDKYTRKSGIISSNKDDSFYDDFNDALRNLFDSDEYQDMTSKVETAQAEAGEYMKKLQSPPDDLKACYDTLNDMYGEFATLTGLAVNPTGSLESFTASLNDCDSSFMKHYEKLGTQIPEE